MGPRVSKARESDKANKTFEAGTRVPKGDSKYFNSDEKYLLINVNYFRKTPDPPDQKRMKSKHSQLHNSLKFIPYD